MFQPANNALPAADDKNHMRKLKSIMDSVAPEVSTPMQQQYSMDPAMYDDMDYDPDMASFFGGQRPPARPVQSSLDDIPLAIPRHRQMAPTHRESYTYKISSTTKTDNGTIMEFYSIQRSDGDLVFSNICLEDAAKTIVFLLGKGFDRTSKKIEEVLSLDEDYRRAEKEMSVLRSRHKRSVELKESDAAKVFKQQFETAKLSKMTIKDKINIWKGPTE